MSYIRRGKKKGFPLSHRSDGAYDRNVASRNIWVYNSEILQGIVSECWCHLVTRSA